MKTNFAIYAAAMNLVKSSAGTLTVEGLKEEITKQQSVVDKVNKEFAEETDSTKRLALQLTAKNEADSLNEKMTALGILQSESVVAENLVESNRSQIRSWGFLVNDSAKTGSIADAVAQNKKSLFSRVF